MHIDVLTTFPEMLRPVLEESILKRAQAAGVVTVNLVDLRDYTDDRHRTTDDAPFGGGVGMVMKPEPFFRAVRAIRHPEGCREEVILFAPQGQRFDQGLAKDLSTRDHLILLCGHYEGVDHRVEQALTTMTVSLGDYVLTGGELPALVVIDAVTRLLPGALGDDQSADTDSFTDGLLEYPQFTRPAEYEGRPIPDVLLSGHHDQIRRWRRKESLRLTKALRPDLFAKVELTKEDRKLLREIDEEEQR